jgi:hypothetical protein
MLPLAQARAKVSLWRHVIAFGGYEGSSSQAPGSVAECRITARVLDHPQQHRPIRRPSASRRGIGDAK